MQHFCAFNRFFKVKKPTPKGVTLILHCLKCLVWSQAFTSITYVCHYVIGVTLIYIYLYMYYKTHQQHTVAAAVGYIILDHTTLTRPTLPLIGYILLFK